MSAGSPTLRNLKITGNQTADGPDATSMSPMTPGRRRRLLHQRFATQTDLVHDRRKPDGHGGRLLQGSGYIYGSGGNGAGVFSRGFAPDADHLHGGQQHYRLGRLRLRRPDRRPRRPRRRHLRRAGSKFTVSGSILNNNVTGAGVTKDQGDIYTAATRQRRGFYGTSSAASFTTVNFSPTRPRGANGLIGGDAGAGAGIYFEKGAAAQYDTVQGDEKYHWPAAAHNPGGPGRQRRWDLHRAVQGGPDGQPGQRQPDGPRRGPALSQAMAPAVAGRRIYATPPR